MSFIKKYILSIIILILVIIESILGRYELAVGTILFGYCVNCCISIYKNFKGKKKKEAILTALIMVVFIIIYIKAIKVL
ncbi:hypothetical protein [Terrisporobacter mayombei]|uniref:hypothetical protein n=1 Tax=Terrisporobacter mayombei TaxID=1541 RepID=UPI0026585309|nr:hypothetical protein [Terrisporobacter mayombei]MCC3668022.1 hypothetical protein [Terrisporobacter mayombei]